jgi:hypothetical protein
VRLEPIPDAAVQFVVTQDALIAGMEDLDALQLGLLAAAMKDHRLDTGAANVKTDYFFDWHLHE